MLVLPGRLEHVYWYIPMIGLAIAVAVIASRTPRWAIALFFVVWLPVNYAVLREKRRSLLAVGDEHRWYTMGLMEYARHVPKLKAVVFQAIPRYMGAWGVEGAIRHVFGYEVDITWYGDADKARKLMAEVPMAIVGYHPWDRTVKGLLRTRDEPSSYIRFEDEFPQYQFGEGWEHEWGVQSRIATQAKVTLFRPPESKQFEIVAGGPAKVTVFEDDRSLGTQTLTGHSVQPLRWHLPDNSSGSKKITIRSEDNPVAIRAIGYVNP
jgi:hypothetical protein